MTCDTMSHLLMGNYRIHLAGGWGWWWIYIACDTMSHLLMGNYRIYLAGGWGWWWRVELAGGTRPGGEKIISGSLNLAILLIYNSI